MIDHTAVKLGRKPRRYDRRTLRLARYLSPSLPAPPESVDNTHGVISWGAMLNNQYGCCTVSAIGHLVQIWTLSQGTEVTVPDSDILQAYEQWDGYNPADPATDQGGDMLTVCQKFKASGLGGHQIIAYMSVDPSDESHVKSAIELFGAVYVGVQLPLTAQGQKIWDMVPGTYPNNAPGSWGGHAIAVPAYGPNAKTCVTWGELQEITNAFWDACCDECYVILSADWKPPAGFDQELLMADLSLVCN